MSTPTVDIDWPVDRFARTDPKARKSRAIAQQASSTTVPQREELLWERSTAQHDRPRELAEKVRALFAAGKEQAFEDGIESEFSKELVALVKEYRNDALAELAYFIVYEKVNAEIASEALRWLGLMNHHLSHRWRLWLLEHSLGSSSARVRDGASLGLAFLDDPSAVPYLQQTIQREPVEDLRQDMLQVLEQLESSGRCHSS